MSNVGNRPVNVLDSEDGDVPCTTSNCLDFNSSSTLDTIGNIIRTFPCADER